IQETGRDSDPLCQVKISDIFWVNCIRVNAFLATHHSYNSRENYSRELSFMKTLSGIRKLP
ncbi:unnamed protein product, partial [Allacma fusca]